MTDKRYYALMHLHGCGGPAIMYSRKVFPTDPYFLPGETFHIDGRPAVHSDVLACDSCRKLLGPRDMQADFIEPFEPSKRENEKAG